MRLTDFPIGFWVICRTMEYDSGEVRPVQVLAEAASIRYAIREAEKFQLKLKDDLFSDEFTLEEVRIVKRFRKTLKIYSIEEAKKFLKFSPTPVDSTATLSKMCLVG